MFNLQIEEDFDENLQFYTHCWDEFLHIKQTHAKWHAKAVKLRLKFYWNGKQHFSNLIIYKSLAARCHVATQITDM